MANDPDRLSLLDTLIRQAGVPIDGLSLIDVNSTPVNVTVQYQTAATTEQRTLAAQIVSDFDWRARVKLDRNTIVAAYQSLNATQKGLLLAHILSEYLRDNPNNATVIGQFLGVPITVDQVAP